MAKLLALALLAANLSLSLAGWLGTDQPHCDASSTDERCAAAPNVYSTLGVAANADKDAIQKAYRKLGELIPVAAHSHLQPVQCCIPYLFSVFQLVAAAADVGTSTAADAGTIAAAAPDTVATADAGTIAAADAGTIAAADAGTIAAADAGTIAAAVSVLFVLFR